MPLRVRVFECPNCGNIPDRDLNASKNIERWFEGIFIPERSELAVSSTPVGLRSRQTRQQSCCRYCETGS
jgi:transposase